MRMCLSIASLCLLAACAQLPAFAAGREKVAEPAARVIAATAFASAEGEAHTLDSYTRQLYVPWYDTYGSILKIGGAVPGIFEGAF